MSTSYVIAGDKIDFKDLPELLDKFNVTNLLVRRYIESKHAQAEKPTKEEQIKYQKRFFRRLGLNNSEDLKLWMSKQSQSERQISNLMYKSLQLELFKYNKFKDQVESYFLENKELLDQVSYSLIRVNDKLQIHEMFLRLQEEDSTFFELATKYSIGSERNTNGLVGPVELGKLHPELAERLRISKPEQLWPPFQVDNQAWVIIRFERLIPAKLNNGMKKRIMDELYEKWINEQVLSALKSRLKTKNINNQKEKVDNNSQQLLSEEEIISKLPEEDKLNPFGSFLKKIIKK